jgi:long-chain acyl-CoA synthetase
MPSVAHEERARALYTKSIPQLFLDKVQRFENDPAFFYKKNGIYREVTWGAYRNRVKDFCLGLISLGLEKGERVAFMGDTCPEYFIGDLAALCAGAVTYGIYATCSEAETEHHCRKPGICRQDTGSHQQLSVA